VNNWTIRRRLMVSFGVILALMLVMGAVAYTALGRIEKGAASAADDSIPGLYSINQLRSNLILNYALTVQYVGQADILAAEKLAERLVANQQAMDESIGSYDETIAAADDKATFALFKDALRSYQDIQSSMIALSAELEIEKANQLWREQLDPAFEKMRGIIQTLVDVNNAAAVQSIGQITGAIDRAKIGMLASFIVSLLFTFIGAHYLLKGISGPLQKLAGIVEVMRAGDFSTRLTMDRHDEFHTLAEGFNRMTDELTALVGQVQKSSSQVNNSVMAISTAAKQQQATATEIAATTTEIGATSKEISATSKELVRTMIEVSAVAEQSAQLAGSGQVGMSRMEETMRQVMEAAGSINAKLAVLNEKAGNINQVVTTITKVADQTNLLSLNAAIEAEKAGEYGRGFSVVATEIRRLADQTAVATYDIEQMVKEIQSAVAAGVMGMDKFSEEVRRGMQEVQDVGGQLSQIIHQVQALAPRVESVNEGMQAQATGAEQISRALIQLTEAAQQTVQSLNQSSLAIGELNQVSSGLRSGVARFRLQA
jgi:methyl-accepting chemotaxis protein WspA